MITTAVTPTIEMDFFSDFSAHAHAYLTAGGYQISASEAPEQICMKYFNVHKRRISVRPRKVLVSKDLQCPLDVRPGLNEIVRRAEAGEDLCPYQSKEILLDPEYNDQLLNHWGIHHLHLGLASHKKHKNLVKRTGLLLLARVTEDTLYCINILGHGSWTQQKLLEIVHRNWPASIAHLRWDNAIGEQLSDRDIEILRSKNCNVALAMIDGVSYLPLGNGSSSSGTSVDVVSACARIRSTCRRMEDLIRKQLPTQLKEEQQGMQSRYQFKLQITDNQILAIDPQAGVSIKFGSSTDLGFEMR